MNIFEEMFWYYSTIAKVLISLVMRFHGYWEMLDQQTESNMLISPEISYFREFTVKI